MERLPLSVNKNNLLHLEEELSFAAEGRELLEQKKDALLIHIGTLSTKAQQVRSNVNTALENAYGYLRKALLIHGRPACERAAFGAFSEEEVRIREKSFMGVMLPEVTIRLPKLSPSRGFYKTGAAMDAVTADIRRSLEIMAELAEIEVGLFRLITETGKTLKRLNALQNIYIPLYQATIKYIEENIEEKEREFMFQLKRQKVRRKGKDRGDDAF